MTNLEKFEKRLQNELLNHICIVKNNYCNWFEKGEATLEDVIDLTEQFSVFSNQFIIAQLYKVLNAPALEEMRAGKEILMNELGVSFNKEGSVQGSIFRFKQAHFEWLLDFAKPLGLKFSDLGTRKVGQAGTLYFCDQLIKIYGSDDYMVGAGASYAIENWAAAGFWKQLINGFELFSEKYGIKLDLGFFKFHDMIEDNHAEATQEEMRLIYENPDFDEDLFIASGNKMLDGCYVFWNTLWHDRNKRIELNLY